MSYLIVFIAGFASVFLLGFQSRNVNHGNYRAAALTSFVIAQTQGTLWFNLFEDMSWQTLIVYGMSGSLGITSSMYVHQRWFLPTKKTQTKE